MKKIPLLLSLLLLVLSTVSGQSMVTLSLEKKHKVVGTVFPKDYKFRFFIGNVSNRFTPSYDDLLHAEQFLLLDLKEVEYGEFADIDHPISEQTDHPERGAYAVEAGLFLRFKNFNNGQYYDKHE